VAAPAEAGIDLWYLRYNVPYAKQVHARLEVTKPRRPLVREALPQALKLLQLRRNLDKPYL